MAVRLIRDGLEIAMQPATPLGSTEGPIQALTSRQALNNSHTLPVQINGFPVVGD